MGDRNIRQGRKVYSMHMYIAGSPIFTAKISCFVNNDLQEQRRKGEGGWVHGWGWWWGDNFIGLALILLINYYHYHTLFRPHKASSCMHACSLSL